MARSVPPFDPAFALAAACAVCDDARLSEVAPALLAQGVFDWQRFARVAFYSEVAPVALARLAVLAPEAMPAELAARIREAQMHASALQAAQAVAAVRIGKVLTEAGVAAVVIKGLGLARLLYDPSPELRPSNDIDVVIAPEDLPAADRALRAGGLDRTWPESEPPEAARPMLLRLANVFNYRGGAFNELLELHCRPTINPYWMPVTFAELHTASVEVDLGPGRVRVLDGPLNVHYLAQHALYYLGYRLKWFGDLARALRREEAPSCAQAIARYPLVLPRQPGLLADEVLQLLERGIEQAAAGRPEAQRASKDAALIVRHMFGTVRVPLGRNLKWLPLELWQHSLAIRHLPGWRGKARQVLLALSQPRDALALRLGPGFAPVYALVGPFLSFFRFLARGKGAA